MITLSDIIKAARVQITQTLKYTDYKSVEFSSTDIREKIIRPSFYIDAENTKIGLFNSCTKERKLELKIYYFTKDYSHCREELLNIQDYLENIFLQGVNLYDTYIVDFSKDIEFDKRNSEGALICTLYLELKEDVQDYLEIVNGDNTELMEGLDINMDTET